MRVAASTLAISASLLAALPSVAQFTLEPQNPRVHETVYVRATPGRDGCDSVVSKDFTVSMANNRITAVMPVVPATVCFATPPAAQPVHLAIGQLPPGAYEIEVIVALTTGQSSSLGTKSFTVQPRVQGDPVANYTDLWWNPLESGWGLNIVHHPGNRVFATWFTYDAEGRPIWYVVPEGTWISPDAGPNGANHSARQWFNGLVYRTSGPPAGAIDPARVTAQLVGTAQFQFYEWDRMNAVLTIDGRTSRKSFQRQPI